MAKKPIAIGADPVPPVCGIVMPISAIDGLSEKHWLDVRHIISEAIKKAGFEPRLVSDADDVGIIHKRIVQNLYQNEIIVCDVSAKNPNVMFELGLRLAFDKPVVIIKDEATNYSFDTSSIEHISYPRDLRFNRIVDFGDELARKVKATHEANKSEPASTSFLKNFGAFQSIKVETAEVTPDVALLESIQELRNELATQRHQSMDVGRRRGGQTDAMRFYGPALRRAAQHLDLRSKARIRDNKERLREMIQKDHHPSEYFNSAHDFERWFDGFFDALYG